MDFGAIIKRSWQITWRYKALWVLGIFAGVSGCSASGGGGNSFDTSSFDSLSGNPGDLPDLSRAYAQLATYVPLLLAIAVLLVVFSFVWWVFAVAARGALVTGVNDTEEGRTRPLRALWSEGFSRFWTLFGLEVVLKLPLAVVGLVMVVAAFFGVAAPLLAGREPDASAALPFCGSLVIGVPILLVGGLVLGVMHLIGLRYVMLGGQGALEAAGNAWRFFRASIKDTFLMWLINAALNLVASFVLVIPAIVVGVVVTVPLVAVIASEQWGALWALVPIVVVLVMLLGFAYSAIWGTYTSALWTLFFRRAAGMHVEPVLEVRPAPLPATGPDQFAAADPQPPTPDPAPPIAGYDPPAGDV